MPEQESKFSGLFDDRIKNPPAATRRTDKAPAPVKNVGRHPGKRSDPDYKQYSVLLKRQTHKQATRLLDDLENGQDLSDLMQQLLEQWVNKQSKKAQ